MNDTYTAWAIVFMLASILFFIHQEMIGYRSGYELGWRERERHYSIEQSNKWFITDDWLLCCGFEVGDDGNYWLDLNTCNYPLQLSSSGTHDAMWYCFSDSFGGVGIETRGELRELFNHIGEPLPEDPRVFCVKSIPQCIIEEYR